MVCPRGYRQSPWDKRRLGQGNRKPIHEEGNIAPDEKKHVCVKRGKERSGQGGQIQLANIGQVPSYISLMTALDYYEITTQMQRVFFESVAVKKSKEIIIDGSVFRYVKLAANLYTEFKKEKIFLLQPLKKRFWTHFT